eukprot:INCI5342.5.p1 GENE.INCI5342.5~~INCI5342.5.p1  ORF type:complete len:212 (-),score=33.89 INCI5342.5:158-793(-)
MLFARKQGSMLVGSVLAAFLVLGTQAVKFKALPTNTTDACQLVEGFPYCGQYVSYAINSTTFSTKESIVDASDEVFQTYVSFLDSMRPLLDDDNFDSTSWQVRCQGHIAYYYCLEKFPACIDRDSWSAANSTAFEVGTCQFACHDFRRYCDVNQYFFQPVPPDSVVFNPAGKLQLTCDNKDGPNLECSIGHDIGINAMAFTVATGVFVTTL